MFLIVLIVLALLLFGGGFHPAGADSRNILWIIAALILIYLLFSRVL